MNLMAKAVCNLASYPKRYLACSIWPALSIRPMELASRPPESCSDYSKIFKRRACQRLTSLAGRYSSSLAASTLAVNLAGSAGAWDLLSFGFWDDFTSTEHFSLFLRPRSLRKKRD
jgi:hypothetical protein